jgi:uncharacterized protein YgiB involved in biofilm formation
MKRSSYIILGTAGVLLVASLWPRNVSTVGSDGVSTGGDMNDLQAFQSLDECKAHPALNAERCTREFARAQENYLTTAPKFTSQQECEGQFGAEGCRQTTFNGTSVFVPALMGFLIARSLTSSMSPQALLPARTGPVACPPGNTLPECQPRQSSSSSGGSSGGGGSSSGSSSSRRYSTSTGWSVIWTGGGGSATRTTTVSPTRGSSPTISGTSRTSQSSTVSRGGFGSSGSSFSASS